MQIAKTSMPAANAPRTQPSGIAAPKCLLAQVHALNADVAAHWRAALQATPLAMQYLRARGIGGAVAARFGLGYARPAWRDLGEVLARHSDEAVLASGLLVATDNGATSGSARRFDRFRDRIVFPILTREGSIAGFGGRVLGVGEQPKYLNSPEGIAFTKGSLLYGLFEAERAIGLEGSALVVEGYMDVVSLAQAGVDNAVATLGTSCRREQLAELLALTERLVFCFDGDTAGRAAAARALRAVLPFATGSKQFGFVFLPDGHDPDSFVRQLGAGDFRAAAEAAMPLSAFLVEQASTGCDLRDAEGRARCAAQARVMWHEMPDGVARDALLDHCAGMLKFARGELLGMWDA